MKKEIIVLILAFLICGSSDAQRVASFFVIMPDELLPQLETNRRKDLVDFAKIGRKDKVENRLGGESEIIEMSDDFLAVRLSEQSTMQLKLLNINDTTTLIGVIRTVCAPACDSRLRFYDTSWKEQPSAAMWQPPVSGDFFDGSGDSVASGVQESDQPIDMMLTEYSFYPDNDRLSVRLTVKDYLPEKVYDRIDPLLKKEPLVWIWEGGRFRAVKE